MTTHSQLAIHVPSNLTTQPKGIKMTKTNLFLSAIICATTATSVFLYNDLEIHRAHATAQLEEAAKIAGDQEESIKALETTLSETRQQLLVSNQELVSIKAAAQAASELAATQKSIFQAEAERLITVAYDESCFKKVGKQLVHAKETSFEKIKRFFE